MPTKDKLNYTAEKGRQGKDLFLTPNHATRLLLPYVPENIMGVWEPACGPRKISKILAEKYEVLSTDIVVDENDFATRQHDFLSNSLPWDVQYYDKPLAIVTNPPFSLKKQFFHKCIEYQLPFALLIPFDMTGWIWTAFKFYGCQGIVPSRRINFITPTGRSGKDSSAKFHSFWLTKGFNLPNQFEWVELTKEMMQDV
jgi:hypothetical protein